MNFERLLYAVLAILLLAFGGVSARAQESRPEKLWLYEVALSSDGSELAIGATFSDIEPEFLLAGGFEFVGAATARLGATKVVPVVDGDFLRVKKGKRGDWRLDYRFRLRDAANRFDTWVEDEGKGAAILVPGAWLLRPAGASGSARVRLETKASSDLSIVLGARLAADGKAHEFGAGEIALLPYAAFGALRRSAVEVGGARLELAFLPGKLALTDAAVAAWIKDTAAVVAAYYERFPVKRTLVIVRPTKDEGVGQAAASGIGGTAVLLPLGSAAGERHLAEDWVLTHEMIHLALPNLPPSHRFLEEGIATYVEPIARAMAGRLKPEEVFAEWVRDMPQGEPGEKEENGLVGTEDWGRTYWGGAAFCLLVDVRIRARTDGKKGLIDILRAIQADGASLEDAADMRRLIPIAERATGTTLFGDLYEDYRARPKSFMLDRLWEQLGVAKKGDSVVFDDAADLARIRRSLFVLKREPGR